MGCSPFEGVIVKGVKIDAMSIDAPKLHGCEFHTGSHLSLVSWIGRISYGLNVRSEIDGVLSMVVSYSRNVRAITPIEVR